MIKIKLFQKTYLDTKDNKYYSEFIPSGVSGVGSDAESASENALVNLENLALVSQMSEQNFILEKYKEMCEDPRRHPEKKEWVELEQLHQKNQLPDGVECIDYRVK